MKKLLLILAIVLVALPAGASKAASSCSWTRSGTLTNNTGYPVRLSDRDGILRAVLVPAGTSIPFAETFPWRVKRHLDYLTTTSVDVPGGNWKFTDPMWLYRPKVGCS